MSSNNSAFGPYTFRKDFQYLRYLENKSHFSDLGAQIDQSISRLAFSNAEIARLSAAQTHNVVEQTFEKFSNRFDSGMSAISTGIDRLDGSLQNITTSLTDLRGAVEEVSRSIESGFRLTALALDAIEGALQDILKTLKSPERTWALEKYEIAKDLFRREFNADALAYINDAMCGHGDRRGYLFDPQFHMLKGHILLGDGENFTPELIDLHGAKKCFDDAAKYAKPPRDLLINADTQKIAQLYRPRVIALCCSGWASYIQGEINAAEASYRQAISEDPDNARANYYLGKVLCHQSQFEDAEKFLDRAIRINIFYAAKLSGDGDYLRDRARFEKVLQNYRQELIDEIKPFAKIMCLLENNNSRSLVPNKFEEKGVALSFESNDSEKISMARSILEGRIEIAPMVTNKVEFMQYASHIRDEIEGIMDARQRALDYRKNNQETFTKTSWPSESFNKYKIIDEHRKFGWIATACLFVMSLILDSLPLLYTAGGLAIYAIVGAPIFGRISEKNFNADIERRWQAEYKRKLDLFEAEQNSLAREKQSAMNVLQQIRSILGPHG